MERTKRAARIFCMVALSWPWLASPPADASDRPRVGLVLSGGGARGLAHIGVLRVMEELRVPVDAVAGTSMGAIIGALYAAGYSPDELERIVTELPWSEVFADGTPRENTSFRRKQDTLSFLTAARAGVKDGKLLLPPGILGGQHLNLALRRLLAPVESVRDFDELHLPFRAVSADLATGEAFVHEEGDLVTAVRASMSIPGVFYPVRAHGRLLVDGGVANNMPIDQAFALGADVVIAVDVGTPLRSSDELSTASALSITNQVLAILTRARTREQRALLRTEDVLIVPELEGVGPADFERAAEIVPTGVSAANQVRSELLQLTVSADQFASYLALQRQGETQPPIISRLELTNDSRLDDRTLRSHLRTEIGQPLDIDQLEADIEGLYGLGVFDRVDYIVEETDQGHALRIRAEEKARGPNYVRMGLALEENFDNTSVYGIGLSYTVRPVNERGGEWRNEMQLGSTLRLFSEFWQPLDYDSRWFVSPSFEFLRRRVPVYEGDDRVAEIAVRETILGLDFGRQLGNWGEFRLGARWQDGRSSPVIGPSVFRGTDADGGGVFARLAVDTLDDPDFPTRGWFSEATLGAVRKSFGADDNFELASFSLARFQSFGSTTVGAFFNGSFLSSSAPEDVDDFERLGGFLNLSGFDRGQLVGRHAVIGRLVAYRRVANLGLLNFRYPVYLGGSVELGNTWLDRDDIGVGSALWASSVFLGVDTPLGPLYLGYGVGEGGHQSPYLFLGRTF